jgi:hemin uptake protein HemP
MHPSRTLKRSIKRLGNGMTSDNWRPNDAQRSTPREAVQAGNSVQVNGEASGTAEPLTAGKESDSQSAFITTSHCAPPLTGDAKTYCFDDLAAGHPLVYIEIHGTRYTLRRTRAGGLILNK